MVDLLPFALHCVFNYVLAECEIKLFFLYLTTKNITVRHKALLQLTSNTLLWKNEVTVPILHGGLHSTLL